MKRFRLFGRPAAHTAAHLWRWRRTWVRSLWRWLTAYAVLALALPCVTLAITERYNAFESIAAVGLPVALYTFALSLFRDAGKGVWAMFPFIFLSAFQMVLLYLYGEGIISVDMWLNLITTNAAEAGELLGNLLPAVVLVIVVYVPLLTLASVAVARKSCRRHDSPRQLRRWSLALASACVLLIVAMKAAVGYRLTDKMFPVNVLYNVRLAACRTYATAHYSETSSGYTFRCTPRRDCLSDSAEVYCLIVGETARAANWQLFGYRRQTNPELARTDGIVAFGKAMTQSNTTHKSVPMMLSEATALTFDSIATMRSVIAAFREAGYYTAFISNQRRNHSYIDFFGEQADRCDFLKEDSRSEVNIYDEELVAAFDSLLAHGHKKLFVVLHCYGSHFCYRDRYPAAYRRFTPDAPADAKPENKPYLVNGYDNSLLFTDHILASLARSIEASGRAGGFIYASDHGENLYDDSRQMFLHAGPRPSKEELHVPMILYLSSAYRRALPSVARTARRNSRKLVETSASVFHTALALAGLHTPRYTDTLSVVSPRYRCPEPLYLTDRNEACPVGGKN